MTSDFWQGLVVGLFLGLSAGVLLAKSYVLMKQAIRERNNNKESTMRPFLLVTRTARKFGSWVGHQPYERTLLTLLAVVLVGVGTFQIISYAKFVGYVNCNAQYNQDSGETRNARLKPSSKELNKLFKWVQSVRPLIQNPETPLTDEQRLRRLARFTATLDKSIEAHQEKIAVQQANPYPDLPANTCGGNLKND